MKYCPYCGTVLVDGVVSFCMECGKKLPIKDEERAIFQNNDNEVLQKAAGSGIESWKEKMTGKRNQKSSQKQNVTRDKEQTTKKKRRLSELPEEEDQSIEPTKKPEKIPETSPEDDYDGYYDDILPTDEGRFSEGMDKNLIKKVIAIIGAVLLIVALSWTENIAVRILIYLMVTYQDYIKKTKQNVYKSKKIKLPRPEMYMVYTGSRKERPEYISLAEEFFDGQSVFLETQVKVLYGSNEGDIISQYVTFTKVYDEQRKLHGRTRKAVTETIRICKDKNVLREYLEEREKEVENIMLAMYDEKEILLEYIESERYEAEKKADKRTALQMVKAGRLSLDEVLQFFPSLTSDDIKELQEELLQSV